MICPTFQRFLVLFETKVAKQIAENKKKKKKEKLNLF